MEKITAFQAVTLSIALLGAFLGLINTWLAVQKAKVRLRVVPAHAISFSQVTDQGLRLAIEVTNVGDVAVTVYDVGLFYKGTKNRASIVRPVLADNGEWPRRLEPRSSVTVYSQLPESRSHRITCAYAKTQCGVTVRGNSPALRQIAASLQ